MQVSGHKRMTTQLGKHYPWRNLTGPRATAPERTWDQLLKRAFAHRPVRLPKFLSKTAAEYVRTTMELQKVLVAIADFYERHDPERLQSDVQELSKIFGAAEGQSPARQWVYFVRQQPELVAAAFAEFGSTYNAPQFSQAAMLAAAPTWQQQDSAFETGQAAGLGVAAADIPLTVLSLAIPGAAVSLLATYAPLIAQTGAGLLEDPAMVIQNQYLDALTPSLLDSVASVVEHQAVVSAEETLGPRAQQLAENPGQASTPEEQAYVAALARRDELRNRASQTAEAATQQMRGAMTASLWDQALTLGRDAVPSAQSGMYNVVSPVLSTAVQFFMGLGDEERVSARRAFQTLMAGSRTVDPRQAGLEGQLLAAPISIGGQEVPPGTRITADLLAHIRANNTGDITVSDPGIVTQVTSVAPEMVKPLLEVVGYSQYALVGQGLFQQAALRAGTGTALGRGCSLIASRLGGALTTRIATAGASSALSTVGATALSLGALKAQVFIAGGRGFWDTYRYLADGGARAEYERKREEHTAWVAQASLPARAAQLAWSSTAGILFGDRRASYDLSNAIQSAISTPEEMKAYRDEVVRRQGELQERGVTERQERDTVLSTIDDAKRDILYALPGLEDAQARQLAEKVAEHRWAVANFAQQGSGAQPDEEQPILATLRDAAPEVYSQLNHGQLRFLSSLGAGMGEEAVSEVLFDMDASRKTGAAVLHPGLFGENGVITRAANFAQQGHTQLRDEGQLTLAILRYEAPKVYAQLNQGQRRLLHSLGVGMGAEAASQFLFDMDESRRTGAVVLRQGLFGEGGIITQAAAEGRSLPVRQFDLRGNQARVNRVQDPRLTDAYQAQVKRHVESVRQVSSADDADGRFIRYPMLLPNPGAKDGTTTVAPGAELTREQAIQVEELLRSEQLAMAAVEDGSGGTYTVYMPFTWAQADDSVSGWELVKNVEVADIGYPVERTSGQFSAPVAPVSRRYHYEQALEEQKGSTAYGAERAAREQGQQYEDSLADAKREHASEKAEWDVQAGQLAQQRQARDEQRKQRDLVAQERSARARRTIHAPVTTPSVANFDQPSNIDTSAPSAPKQPLDQEG
jgi:hypothetical protein